MAKYDKMNEVNRQESEKKYNLPLLRFIGLYQRENQYLYLNFP